MTDFERSGGIDDPTGPHGQDVGQRRLPAGDTADNTGGPEEPHASELDLPGPDDPVAWSYIEPGTAVVDLDERQVGTVIQMLGTEEEGIFHGLAVDPERGGAARVVPADAVHQLTPARVQVAYDADQLEQAEEHRPPAER
jgi:hypothetical protein